MILAEGGRLDRSSLWDDADGPPQPLRAKWDPVPPTDAVPPPRRAQARRRRSAIGWFVHHYGWRAYALPVLVALTVVVVIQLVGSSGTDAATPAPATVTDAPVTVTIQPTAPTVTVEKLPSPASAVDASAAPTQTGQPATGLTAGDPNGAFSGVAAGALPPGASFATTGAGTFHVVAGTSEPIGDGPNHRTFTIEVEDGIENAGDDTLFADAVVSILSDSRSWIGSGEFTLQRVDSGSPDFRISLTSQLTVRAPQNCGWQIQLEASCYNRLDDRVFINDARWVRGAVVYNGDLGLYRVYAINHEVGHALGFHHEACPKDGGLAPVMMQQSWSTSDDDLAKLDPGGPVVADGKVCVANPFPFPRGPQTSGSTAAPDGATSGAAATTAG